MRTGSPSSTTSRIEVDFLPASQGATEVVITNTQLHRHGRIARLIRSALDGPSPGATLAKYAEVVARHTATTQG